MNHLLVSVLAALSLGAAATQTFTGTIADDLCGASGHAHMRMGPTDAECTRACIEAHGARYVLDEGQNMYGLSDQKTPEKFAGLKVRVVGVLDAKAKTIRVDSIAVAK